MVFMSIAITAFPEDTEGSAETDGTIITGSGVLVAKGKGKAVLHGHGVVKMAAAGNVTIWDFAGDARVFIGSHPDDDAEAEADTRMAAQSEYELTDFRGLIVVKGSNFKIPARGKMWFKAKGHGTAFLKGKGRWHTRNGTAGTWSRHGLRIRYGAKLTDSAA